MILSRACYLITFVVIHAGKNKKECPGMWQNENRGLKKKKKKPIKKGENNNNNNKEKRRR